MTANDPDTAREALTSPLPIPLYDAAVTRLVDAAAMRDVAAGGMGLEGFELMRRAALAARDLILREWSPLASVSILCGKGNNAGDGYLLAALLAEVGIAVVVVPAVSESELTGDALAANVFFREHIGLPKSLCKIASREALDELEPDLIVDAILGIGFRHPLAEPLIDIVNWINAQACPVLALDMPTGVEVDTGFGSVAVQADVTLTFITQKVGLHTGIGKAFAGRVICDDLAVSAVRQQYPATTHLHHWRARRLPALSVTAHKYQRGRVLLFGGDLGMGGAITLAAEACLRSGAGLVSVVTRNEHRAGLLARLPEAMLLPSENVAAEITDSETSSKVHAIVVGPGLGRSVWGHNLLTQAVRAACPIILDGDALYWTSRDEQIQKAIRDRSAPTVLTPHTGEAAVLLGTNSRAVEADRISAAQRIFQQYGAWVVLKGSGTVVVADDGVKLCGHGGPWMATGGMGDVLSGICGALIVPSQWHSKEPTPSQISNTISTVLGSQTELRIDNAERPKLNKVAADALLAAVLLHSAAADKAAQALAERSVLASDVVRFLPSLLNHNL